MLVSYFRSKNWAFETPLPLGMSANLPSGENGYFLELHIACLLLLLCSVFCSKNAKFWSPLLSSEPRLLNNHPAFSGDCLIEIYFVCMSVCCFCPGCKPGPVLTMVIGKITIVKEIIGANTLYISWVLYSTWERYRAKLRTPEKETQTHINVQVCCKEFNNVTSSVVQHKCTSTDFLVRRFGTLLKFN